jgi:photosystem II stability/assembly factor-like uncharacterized protein
VGPKTHFVVYVDGVGTRAEGETLREFGTALGGWLIRWHQVRQPLRSATPYNLHGVAVGEQVALAVGAAGTIIRSADGGQTWQLAETVGSPADQIATLWAVAFGSAQVAWAVGDRGTILRTVDAGLHWERQPSPTTEDLRGIAAVSANAAWVVGDGGVIGRTINGGEHWDLATLSGKPDLRSVAARSATATSARGSRPAALVAVGPSTLVASKNGGRSWQQQVLDPDVELQAVVLANESPTFWVLGHSRGQPNAAVVFKTVDDGDTWDARPVRAPPDVVPRALLAHSALRAWLGGSAGTILRTHDGGKTWGVDAAGPGDRVWYAGQAGPGSDALVVGSRGAIARNQGAEKAWVETTYPGRPEPATGPSIRFDQFDNSHSGARQSYAQIELPNGDRWLLTEAWWIAAGGFPPVGRLLRWFIWFWSAVLRPLDPAMTWGNCQIQDVIGNVWLPDKVIERINVGVNWCLQLITVIIFLGAPLGLIFLMWPFTLLVPPVSAAAKRLFNDLAELDSYLSSRAEAALMRQRVVDAILGLQQVSPRPNDDTIVIGHSLGSVIAHDVLVGNDATGFDVVHGDPAHQLGPITKFISMGSSLSLLWKHLDPRTAPWIFTPVSGAIHWLNVFTWYDVAAQGRALVPPRKAGNPSPIFTPNATVIAQQHLKPRVNPDPPLPGRRLPAPDQEEAARGHRHYWPESWPVTNQAFALTDHTTYGENTEQVLTRLAAEIDQTYFQDSKYWRGRRLLVASQGATPELARAFRHRYRRVLLLAIARAVLVIYTAVSIAGFLHNPAGGAIPPPANLRDVPRFVADFLWQPSGRTVFVVDWGQRAILAPLGAWLESWGPSNTAVWLRWLDQLADWIPLWLLTIGFGLLILALVYLIPRLIWRFADRFFRRRALPGIANAGLPPEGRTNERRWQPQPPPRTPPEILASPRSP